MTTTTESQLDARAFAAEFKRTLTSVVAIRDELLDPLISGLLSHGHVLIEGRPGIGKTLLARTIAKCVDCQFNRIQFTNDLMPADIVGSVVWRSGLEQFEFVKGPIFANLVLADEINRTSPRTLSCLLEAMESNEVSVDGKVEPLDDPFVVLATRNPIEFHGTFPVPEAALDRFLIRVELDYPEADRELGLYLGDDPELELRSLEPVIDRATFRAFMDAVRDVKVSDAVASYCYRIVQKTREHESIALGASPRAAMSLLAACRARAMIQGRDYVLPDDLKELVNFVLSHRIFRHDAGPVAPLISEIVDREPVEL